MLKRLFIKNYKDTNNPDVRIKYGNVAGFFGIITNLFLGVIKFIIGSISHSVSIMADAVNNISDTASSILTIIGFKLSSKKPNKKHPYGYARYEYVAGFVISIFMFIMGITFAKESILKIINPEKLIINSAVYIVLIVAIIVKGIQMIVYLDFSKAIDSNTLKTNAIDTRNDIISTISILISMIIMAVFDINIDGFLGFAVSLFSIYSSIGTMKEVLEPIIGIVPTEERVEEISKKILSYEYVKGIHDLVIHNYGVNNDFITVHVEIDSKMDILKAHDLMDNIEKDFKDDFGIMLTIHMDPISVGDPKVDDLKMKVETNLKKFDDEIKIHDFRVVEGTTHTNILFDCLLPYDKTYTVQEISDYLIQNIKDENMIYYYIIEIDRPFS